MITKEGLVSDLVAGILWGWLSLILNAMTGIFTPEAGFVYDLGSFALAGAINAFVAGGLLFLFMERLPGKSIVSKAVIVSAIVWLVLRAGAMVLSQMDPERYHVATWESLQGLLLAVLLGVLIGIGRMIAAPARVHAHD